LSAQSTILVVDDDTYRRDILVLDVWGYRTVVARNSREARNKMAQDPPDLILLDVMMAFVDGFGTYRLLKSNETTRLIPIVSITALHAVADRIKGIEAGAENS